MDDARPGAEAFDRGPPNGFGWTMSAMLIFSGAQLVMLGLIGEYIGRIYEHVRQRPRYFVHEVLERKD